MRVKIILFIVIGALCQSSIKMRSNTSILHASLKLPATIQQRLLVIIQHIQQASDQQMLSALYCLRSYLQHVVGSLNHDQSTINKKYITNCRLNHLESALYTYKQKLSWWERSHHFLEHAYQSLQHRHSSTNEWQRLCTFNYLAKTLLDYILIEDEYLLTTYHTALTFFSLCNTLPFVINFWSNPTLQKELAYRLSSPVISTITPQALAAVGEFIANQAMHLAPVALQATIMGGQSMYGQWLSKKAQKKMAALADQQKQLSSSYQEFIVQENTNQASKVSAIVKNFTQAQQTINDAYKKFSHTEQQNYAYILQSINIEQPKAHYLTYPISFDQLFAASTMNTPLTKAYPWYNIYQESSGNWGFYKGCFYQRSVVEYGKPYWEGGSTNPEAVAIFNEWSTDKTPYKLSIEMRILHAQYPFFVGLMFNKARWISGDPERLNSYQLLGLHAHTAKELGFWHAGQTISFDKGLENIVSPLQQIATKKAHLLKALDPLEQIITDPLIYQIELIIYQKNIHYTIKQKSNPESILAAGMLSITDQTLNYYHGFGFIAAGCQACFKIIEPTQLSYVQ